MAKIYLVRHGEVNRPDINYGDLPGIELSETGRRQIEDTARKLTALMNGEPFIVASPLARAQETARIIARQFGDCPIATDARLLEWKMGKWVGKPLDEFCKKSGYYDTPMRIEGMEPLDELADRVIEAIDEAVKNAEGREVIVCAHREPMVAAYLKINNRPWEEIHDTELPKGGILVISSEVSPTNGIEKSQW